MPGLWISESRFVDLKDQSNALASEIAVRSRTIEGLGYFGFLPDPDEVLRKLGQDLTVYRKLLTDSHLWACVLSRTSAVLSCAWQVDENPAATDKAGKQAFKLIDEFMQNADVHQIVTDILKAPLFGMAPIEIVWSGNERSWLPEKIAGKPAEWFVFDTDNRLRFRSRENMLQGEELPDYKVLVPRHFPDYQNPYGERVLSRCFWPVAFKKGGFKFWAIFTEKWGMPWIVGKVPRSTNPTERNQLLGQLVQMVQDAAAVINNDESVEIHEAAGKGSSADIYERLIDVCNKEMSKAVLGQTATTEGTPGKLGDEQSQNETKQEIVDADKRLVKQTFDLLFQWMTELNFSGAAAPVFMFEKEEDVQSDKAGRDETLNRQGVRFKKSYYCRTYNLDEADFDLSEPQAPNGPAAFAETDRGLKKKYPEPQEQIDRLADEAVGEAAAFFENSIKIVKEFFDRIGSLKTGAEQIAGLYGRIDLQALAGLLAAGLVKADALGFESAGRTEFMEAQWGPGTPFSEAIDFFRAKAFTISGVAKADLLAEIKDELVKAMETGATLKDFQTGLDGLFEKHGYNALAPYRIDTIFRTNLQSAYQAGRFRQMTKPEVVAARPFWRYVAVQDASTRPEHAALHGKIFRHDDPFWQTWYPPNGFNCRCTVQTLSENEMTRNGWKAETEDPTGKEIEPIDPVTGEVLAARPIRPDQGWGSRPAQLEKLLESKTTREELGRIVWKENKDQPGPRELGRPAEKEIPAKEWKPSPGKEPRLETVAQDQGLGRSEALAKIEAQYKRIMGIAPSQSMGVLKGPDNEIMQVDLNGLAHAMLKREEGRERFINYFRRTIEDPYEILLTEYRTAERAKTKFRKKYIGLFTDENREGVVIVAEVSPEGWTLWNVMNAKKGTIDRLRRGVKVLYAG